MTPIPLTNPNIERFVELGKVYEAKLVDGIACLVPAVGLVRYTIGEPYKPGRYVFDDTDLYEDE